MSIAIGLAIGGKFLAPHASKAALSLAKKMTYRRRIERNIRRKISIKYSRQHFRSWLKTVNESDLAEPVEIGGSALALKLDIWLGTYDAEWVDRADRVSQALRIVEALYLAILKEADPYLERQLSEQWSRQRNEDLVSTMVKIAGGNAPISSSDRAIWLHRRSTERRRIRLDAFELDLTLIEKSLQTSSQLALTIKPGEFKVLVGSFGAGKSEIAEEWHRKKIVELKTDEFAAIPIWLHAREVASECLETVIRQHAGVLYRHGVAVVIDGLDEVDSASAEIIAHDSRVFLAGDQESCILATCRPNVLPVNQNNVYIEGLNEDEARNLVESLSDARQATWRWTPELIETIKRPFFALAAASVIALNQAPSGQAELIAKLVEQALQRAKDSAAISSREMFDVLVKLGANMTRSNGRSDGLTFYERKISLSTRLVANSQESVAFALPVFEQWFAAQSLQVHPDTLTEALLSPGSFDRWRWALAIAVISSNSDKADHLLEATFKMNPGAGAWLIEQVSYQTRNTTSDQLEPDLPKRLLQATRTWIDAVGPLAPFTFPVANSHDKIRLGIRVQDRTMVIGWSSEHHDADQIVPLPDEVNIFSRGNSMWRTLWSSSVPAGNLWPWTHLRDTIARETLDLLESKINIGPSGGLWHQEMRYRVARIITETTTVRHTPMNRIAIIEAGQRMLAQLPSDVRMAHFSLGSKTVNSNEIQELISWLQGESFDDLKRLVPVPDVEFPTGGWVWDFYSPEQITRFCAETLELACIAYEELADTVFANFDWALGCNISRPFGVIGTVSYSKSATDDSPGLDYEQLPMELIEKEIAKDSSLTVSSNGRAAVRLVRDSSRDKELYTAYLNRWGEITDWAAQHGIESPFLRLDAAITGIDCGHERPVSNQAAQWIWHDLQRLSLASGTFPQLS